jgi:polygalacturonase
VRPFPRLSLAVVLAGARLAPAGPAYVVSDYGATGRDLRGDTAAIQRAIDACSAHGGGRVEIPDGAVYTVATIELRSRVELHLGRGSVLIGSPRNAEFTRFSSPPVTFGSAPVPRMGVILYADGAEDIAVTGDGQINGNEMAYVTGVGPAIYTCTDERPFAVLLKDCRHVLLRDVTLKNSAFWTLRLLGCDDALLDGLRIDGDLRMPNNDGIDIDWSSNVRIRGCDVSTGDDCISLKTAPLSEGVSRPCEHVVVTGCTLRSRSSGVVLGCDVAGPVRDVVVSDCIISDSHRGVAVRLSLGGSIERVLFSNLIIGTRIFDEKWWGRGEPIQVLALPWAADSRLGVIRDVRFSNLICTAENGAMVYAAEPGHIENVSFDRVSIHLVRPAAYPGGRQDLRPTAGDGLPALPTSGFLVRDAAGVRFRDCAVTWGPDAPDYFRYALDAAAAPGLDAAGLAGTAAHPGLPATSIRDTP